MINELYHHGILGQKWGVRNGPPYPLSNSKATKQKGKREKENLFREETIKHKGEKVELSLIKESAMAKFLSTFIPRIKENMSGWRDYTIRDLKGDKVGDLTVNIDSPDSLNLVWISIKRSKMNNGYAQSALRSVIETAKSEKFREITLEVPDDDPNARHIYEKFGFVDIGKIGSKFFEEEDDLWLTKMILKL